LFPGVTDNAKAREFLVLAELLVDGVTPEWRAVHPRACGERFGSLACSSAGPRLVLDIADGSLARVSDRLSDIECVERP
jgi:hypothetical protein